MNFDIDKIIVELEDAKDAVKDIAVSIKKIKQTLSQSGIKALTPLIPELDEILNSLKVSAVGDVNSFNSVISKIDQMPYEALRGSADDEDDIFGEDDIYDDDEFDPETYLDDDDAEIFNDINKASTVPTSQIASARESATLRRLMKKRHMKEGRYKRTLDINRIANDMEDYNPYKEATLRNPNAVIPELNLTDLLKENQIDNFTSSDSFQRMQESLKKAGVTSRMDKNSQNIAKMLEAGRFQEVQRDFLSDTITEKMQEGGSISWEELGSSDNDIDYNACGLAF